MTGNPLVATAESPSGAMTGMGSSDHELDNLNAQTSGAGIFSDVASTITDARAGDWGNLALDAVTDGLDLLGAAMDPLGTLAAAGVGWLIEHISFLKEGLDKLAGSPEAVTAKATTWANIAKQLDESAGRYQQAAAQVRPDFQGRGGSAYQVTAAGYVATLKGASVQAKGTSTGMQIAAALVGTERGIVRDMISSFVGELIVKGLAALAASWCTFGGTIAAFIADTVVEGGILAEKISGRIAKVVEQLDKLAQKAGKAKGAIEDASNALKKIGKGADKLTDKGVDVAANAEQKGLDAKSAARDAGRSHVDESVSDKAERWKDSAGTKPPDSVSQYAEPNRSALNLGKWKEADGEAPRWNRADTTGVITEGRRQENDRAHESAAQAGEGEPK
ncbi:PPE domain-containing protein [Amycolatopsis panacis]|uniref:PPE domain-containing protein n=1 Tax=Amycolatopsis panacis TaxID=2340917 RepID=A0A419IBK0_9PSEU|nr:hypothetical protein [Amycolatopsis panacis]RJQ92034.1 hypothetical protein D5S19_01245 [Amycolatopsis panacis]